MLGFWGGGEGGVADVPKALFLGSGKKEKKTSISAGMQRRERERETKKLRVETQIERNKLQ